MGFEFVTRHPPATLERYVDAIWFARGRIEYRRERIAPTGSTVAIVVLGSPIRQTPDDGEGESFTARKGLLAGPHDRPVVNEPTAETFCVGIVSSPVGCEALFGVRPAAIRGRVVDLGVAWAPADGLRSSLMDLSRADDMIGLAGDVLARHLMPDVSGLARCERAVAALEADPLRSIGAVAAELGISHGHLDREFVRVVGLTPRMLARILRLRRLLGRLDVYGTVEWGGVAADLGWFDQAHLIRDFKRHTGVTPSAYIAAHRELFHPSESAPGFVPETTV